MEEIINQNYKPKIRHLDWSNNCSTLSDLQNNINGDLYIACKLDQLSIFQGITNNE